MVSARYHGLDFARAILMIVGVFYHSSLIYADSGGDAWRVVSPFKENWFHYMSEFMHSFRMEAFYVVSGFFYFLVRGKKKDGFLQDRLLRVLVPMFLVGFTLNYVMNYYSTGVFETDFDLEYYVYGRWLGHLWFIGNLAVYFVASLFLMGYLSFNLDRVKLVILFCLIVPLLATVLRGGMSVLDLNFRFLFISFYELVYYFPYFVLGLICYKNRDAFFCLMNIKFGFISLVLYFSFYFVFDGDSAVDKFFMYFSHGFLSFSVLSFLVRIGSGASSFIRRISDSSYTIYLLHQPIIVIFYIFIVSGYEDSGVEGFLTVSLFTLGVSFLFHEFFVARSSFLRFLFNGVLVRK